MDRPEFTRTLVREGYGRPEVDAAVERAMARAVSADEVRNLTFPPVRYGPGYDMIEVDDWLDEVIVGLGGRPAEPVAPTRPAPELEPDPTSQARADRWQAAIIIALTLAVTAWIYVSRF